MVNSCPGLCGSLAGATVAERIGAGRGRGAGWAVMTLTAYGFVQRSRPGGRPPPPVVMLGKDTRRGVWEVHLDEGAEGVLVTVDLFVADVQQIRAADPPMPLPAPDTTRTSRTGALDVADLTVLASWSDAVAEAIACADACLELVLADAAPGAPWRTALGVAEPSGPLATALDDLRRLGRSLSTSASPEEGVAAVRSAASSDDDLTALAATLLSTALDRRAHAG